MIVVSNTSPIINLAAIGRLELLRELYERVIIPQAVYHEITIKGAGQTGADEIDKLEWIEFKEVLDKNLAEALKLKLDEGIASAILDRLLHYSKTIKIQGDSYRLAMKRKMGLFERKHK